MTIYPVHKLPFAASSLRSGCIIASAAKAIFTASTGLDDDIRWWEGPSYRRSTGSGDIGTIIFSEGLLVGLLFNHESERSPWNHRRADHTLDRYLGAMPSSALDMATKFAVPYMTIIDNTREFHLITSSLWSDGDDLYSCDTVDQLYREGAEVIKGELLGFEDCLREFQQLFRISDVGMMVLRRISEQKRQTPSDWVALSVSEVEMILEGVRSIENSSNHQLSAIEIEKRIALAKKQFDEILVALP